ncbi:hypothetical protein [Streptomyces sp. NPDC019224]|uniref:hypothetical protein n=1 Tax=Streptomyces sp. NPDC019224 TaxID=3154484 RepID=UPI0033C7ECB5
MTRPSGFGYEQHGDAGVTLTHHGRPAGTLRGGRAEKFPAEVEAGDARPVTARWTGAYKHGDERTARDHPRNRWRGRPRVRHGSLRRTGEPFER